MNWIRVFRSGSWGESWLTLQLPYRMNNSDEVDTYLDSKYRGWQFASGCLTNPDEAETE